MQTLLFLGGWGWGVILRYRRGSHCRVLEEAVYRCYRSSLGVVCSMLISSSSSSWLQMQPWLWVWAAPHSQTWCRMCLLSNYDVKPRVCWHVMEPCVWQGRSVIHVLSLSLWQMLKKRGSSVEPPPGSLSDMCVDEMLELMVDHWLLT